MKKSPIITFIISSLICAASAIAPYLIFAKAYSFETMLKAPYHGLFYYIFTISAAFVLASLLAIIFKKTINENCTLKTSLISIGLSATIGFGAYAIISWAVCKYGVGAHSVRYPASIVLGIISLLAFMAFLVLYIFKRSKKLSLSGIIIDMITAIIFAYPFFNIVSAAVTFVLYIITHHII